jgi:hypothetical protein
MRRLFTVAEARTRGLSEAALRWGVTAGHWIMVVRGVYADGSQPPTPLERAIAAVLGCGGVACGTLAARLLELDGVVRLPGAYITVPPGRNGHRRNVRRRALPPNRITHVNRVPCTNGLQTLLDLASIVDDVTWEQALESALRKRLTTIEEVTAAAAALRRSRTQGAMRIRRVLALRPPGAVPTESLLETLFVQLARSVPGLRSPDRQVVIINEHGVVIARVDLAWPELGLFIELDGQQHRDQPVYDAARQTAVIAATGWLCGRFTWTEVVKHPEHTVRQLIALLGWASPVVG